MSDEHGFCRSLYSDVMAEVRAVFTRDEIKRAWVWSGDRKQWEFHGPNGEYYHDCKMSDCVWSARAAGWGRLLAERKESNAA